MPYLPNNKNNRKIYAFGYEHKGKRYGFDIQLDIDNGEITQHLESIKNTIIFKGEHVPLPNDH